MKETENLIVGLGLAGLNLCHQLEKQGRSFLVIDSCPSNSSSLIAAGIYNPIALRRKLKSWKVDELFPCLVEAYSEMDEKLNVSTIHHDFPILKPIVSEDDLNEWKQTINECRLAPYVNSIQEGTSPDPFRENTIATVTIENSGFVRIGKMLLAYREYLKDKGLLIAEDFDHSSVQMGKDHVEYKAIRADRIIFSEGRFISENPFFNWVPLKATKGQILTVRAKGSLSSDNIYNQQFLMFPTEEKDVFKLGATYEWDQIDEIPTAKATEELLAKAEKALTVTFEVLDEKAAIRPTVVDRRPAIGVHPEHKNLMLFNGMGTKGVMLAPYFAKQLVGFIYYGTEIDPEVNLDRFLQKHYKKE